MVGKVCTVCKRCSFIDKQLSFFTYPGDVHRRHEWLKAVDRMDLIDKVDNYKTRGNYRICEVHFEKKYVRNSRTSEGRKFLTKDAFPTLSLDTPSIIVPMNSENFIKPPSSYNMYTQKIWRGDYDSTLSISEMNQKLVLIKKEKKHIMPSRKSGRQEAIALKNNMLHTNKQNLLKVRKLSTPPSPLSTPPSPLSCPPSPLPFEFDDISQLCESVMRVSKGTQTLSTEINKRKLDASRQMNLKIIKTQQDPNVNKESFLQKCSQCLPSSLSKVIKWYLSAVNGRENINFTLFAINLYYSSNLYNLLREMLGLPTKETLKYFLLPKSTRLSENFINTFRCKVNNMSTKERVCSFSVGSFLLRPNLYYDIKHDRIIGLHDVNGEQNLSIAKYAVLLMVEGILENWTQPIAYAFISEYDYFPEISAWIDDVLATLIDIGLDVKAFVSDPRSEFIYGSESTFVTPEKTCFTINGTDVFYTYDTRQLLKIVRNNLKSCNFKYGPNSKISNDNDFFRKLNNLCNMLNANTQFSNYPYKRAFSNKKYQRSFLNEMLDLFQNLKVVRKVDGVDVTANMKFIGGFQITINSVLQLYDELSFLGVKHLLTSRLNQYRLNNFFSKIKPTDSIDECSPRQFNRMFVRNLVFSMLKKPLKNNNLESSLDSEDFLQQLLDEEFKEPEVHAGQPLSVHTIDYRWGLPEKNAFVYVCGYCYLKCIQHHSCVTFRSYLKDYQCWQEKNDLTCLCSVSLDLNVKNCEMLPPDSFTDFLMLLENKFKEYLKQNVPISNIGSEILKEFELCDFGMPCPCFPIEYLKVLFIRVRIFYTVRKNNKLLKKKKCLKTIRVSSL